MGKPRISQPDLGRRRIEGEQERRRYALLQAAATILVHGDAFSAGQGLTFPMAVDAATALLAEIERREKEPK